MELKDRIVEARERAGFAKRRDLADATGIPYETIWRYEEGKREPGVEHLTTLSRILGVRMEWLATGDGPREREDAPATPAPTGTDA